MKHPRPAPPKRLLERYAERHAERRDDDGHHGRPEHEPPEHERASEARHRPEPHEAHERPRAPERHEDHDREREDRDRGYRDDDDDHDLRLTRVVERTWYFEEREHRERDDDDHRDHHGDGGHGGGGHGGDGHPGRPTRPQPPSTGRLGEGTPLGPGDIKHPLPPGVWVGPRGEMQLPMLFMRANSGDLGVRPITNAPFWESPDIFILAGVTPALAPAIPPKLGDIGLAGQPNTLYAHVWNFGFAAANDVLVEFYWCDPALGVNASTVQLIAQTTTSLGAKGSGKNHRVVKCPEAWTPTFVNGGHECLLVRVWDNPSDLPGEPKFDASANRHVAQRNIHVVGPGAAAMMMAPGLGPVPAPALTQPLLIRVGALYGQPAEVSVERVAPNTMPWLQLHTGQRGVFPPMAPPTGGPSLSPPTTGGGGFPPGGGPSQTVTGGDDQQVAFTTTDQAPGPGQAHVYRVSAKQAGAVFGGYTVVVLG